MIKLQLRIISSILIFFSLQPIFAQQASAFIEDFSSPQLTGWRLGVGSGDLNAETDVTLQQKDQIGVFRIDATRDRRNIWWAIMNHEITQDIDLDMLNKPGKAIRIEAKVRLPKPRRFNLSLNHSRTTDFHHNLAEFDIDDTDWHVVSYTNETFDAKPTDRVYVQLAMIDAGREVITVEIDYIKVSIVDAATATPDLGNPLPYRPDIPTPESFAYALPVTEDAIIDAVYPWVNFKTWRDESTGSEPLLSVSSSQISILRWDFSKYAGRKPKGWGLLVLTMHNVQYAPTDLEEFGYLRLVEIKNGDPLWKRDNVTYENLLQGKPESEVILAQLIMDELPNSLPGGKTLIAVSPPVMERLLSGKTQGLAFYAQGAVNASFASSRVSDVNQHPVLYFDVE